MQNKKLVSVLTIVSALLSFPLMSIPSVHAFHSDGLSYDTTGLVIKSYPDPFLGSTVNAAREGSTVNYNFRIQASSTVGQRNITVGMKFDWMANFVNASNANPSGTYALAANGLAIIAVSISVPSLTGSSAVLNAAVHSWEARVWSGKANTIVNSTTGNDCFSHSSLSGCINTTSSNFAIYSGAQADGVLARQEANSRLSGLTTTLSFLLNVPPGAARAVADASSANAEVSLGDTAYGNGDFAGAKTHYTSALNLANSATGALSGGDSATYTNTLLNGIGWLLMGVGVIMGGLGAFWFLNKRGKSMMMPK